MAEQPDERQGTAEIGEELISLMVPDVDPELVQFMLGRAVRSAASGRDDEEVRRDEPGKPRARLLQEQAELLGLIRDAKISSAQLSALLGLNPDAPSADDDPRPPVH